MTKVLKSLGVIGSFRLVLQFLLSKLLFPKARIIRYPFFLKKEGTIDIGRGFSADTGLKIETFGLRSFVQIHDNVIVNRNLHIGSCYNVVIGENVLMGSDCLIIDHSHGSYGPNVHSSPNVAPVKRALIGGPIVIGKNCWLGDRVTVLPGITIGEGVVIGVGATVTKDIPPYSIAVGSPAKIIKRYKFEIGEWTNV